MNTKNIVIMKQIKKWKSKKNKIIQQHINVKNKIKHVQNNIHQFNINNNINQKQHQLLQLQQKYDQLTKYYQNQSHQSQQQLLRLSEQNYYFIKQIPIITQMNKIIQKIQKEKQNCIKLELIQKDNQIIEDENSKLKVEIQILMRNNLQNTQKQQDNQNYINKHSQQISQIIQRNTQSIHSIVKKQQKYINLNKTKPKNIKQSFYIPTKSQKNKKNLFINLLNNNSDDQKQQLLIQQIYNNNKSNVKQNINRRKIMTKKHKIFENNPFLYILIMYFVIFIPGVFIGFKIKDIRQQKS